LGGGITVLAPALGVHLSFGRLSGGLCCAATAGYYLATLRVAGRIARNVGGTICLGHSDGRVYFLWGVPQMRYYLLFNS